MKQALWPPEMIAMEQYMESVGRERFQLGTSYIGQIERLEKS